MNFDNPLEWTEADLQNLISVSAQETSKLEFKRCHSLLKKGVESGKSKSDVSVDVSAFANSDGGTIVYGMIEKDGFAEKLDEGYDPKELPKEWLESVIHDNIKPPIKGVQINSIPLTSSSGDRVVHIVSIPKGETCHQAADNKYHRRTNTSNRELEHWEIEEIKDRAKKPKVDVFFYATPTGPGGTGQYLNIQLKNSGGTRARDLKVVFTLPRIEKHKLKGIKSRPISISTEHRPVAGLEYVIQRSDQVLFPQDDCHLTDNDRHFFMVTHDRNANYDTTLLDLVIGDSANLTWTLYVDDMEPKKGQILLGEITNLVC